jgi:hypothetical protein
MQPKLKYAMLTVTFLLAAGPLALQYQTGSIEGTVTRPDTSPIAGACVEARNLMTGAFLRVKTDAAGHFDIRELRAGRYSLWVEADSHSSLWVVRVVVSHGQATRQDIQLVPKSPIT